MSRLLPLAEYTAVIQRFVETRSGYGWGTVAQSVAACMRALLDDWEVMVMQLEHQLRVGRLSLQGLWFHCQQPLVTLRLLAGIAAEASRRGLRGAGLLDLLSARQNATAGDVQALRVVQQLLKEAARPYFGMLQRWMCEGVVEDPYAEFMVQEDKACGGGGCVYEWMDTCMDAECVPVLPPCSSRRCCGGCGMCIGPCLIFARHVP